MRYACLYGAEVMIPPGRKKPTSILDSPEASGAHSLFGLNHQQLTDILAEFSEPAYRVKQLSEALYRQWEEDLTKVSTLPGNLRVSMVESGYKIGLPRIVESFVSIDGTERYLIAGNDGQTVETVWMPDGDGGEAGDGSESGTDLRRATICVSSQIGCAVNCQFCLTAKMGIIRNLTAGEIAGQVVAVLKRHQIEIGKQRINLVFMGMGEPFLNYDEFMAAVRLLVEEVGIPESRMTVSTSGIIPGILRFAQESVRPKLAISLNAPNDAARTEIMPITKKWDLGHLIQAVRQVPLRAKEKITFEYVLLGGLNDRERDADEVGRLLRRANLPLKVNLIVWNPGPGMPYRMSDPHTVHMFQYRIKFNNIPAYVRRPRGRDIFAACGQLKRTTDSLVQLA
jgi:23S rRNA (adenine2503-C2)-methyltransferase